MPVEIIEEKTINLTELKEEIENIKKRSKEPGLRTGKTEDYLNMFLELSPKQGEELKKKLQELKLTRLKDEHINKIIDLMPVIVEDLKLIFQGYGISLSADDMEKILKVTRSFKK